MAEEVAPQDRVFTTDPNQKEFKEDLSKPETVVGMTPITAKTGDLLTKLIELSKRYNGYPYLSVSRMLKYEDDKDKDIFAMSALARRIRLNFIMAGRGDVDKFKECFVGAPVAYVQAHAELPTMAGDGLYNAIDVHGKEIKSRPIADFILTEPDKFEPFILCTYRDKNNVLQKGIIKGDPYHTVTKEEADAVLKMNQSPEEEKK